MVNESSMMCLCLRSATLFCCGVYGQDGWCKIWGKRRVMGLNSVPPSVRKIFIAVFKRFSIWPLKSGPLEPHPLCGKNRSTKIM